MNEVVVSEYKDCPVCRESIKAKAILCRFCQTDLRTLVVDSKGDLRQVIDVDQNKESSSFTINFILIILVLALIGTIGICINGMLSGEFQMAVGYFFLSLFYMIVGGFSLMLYLLPAILADRNSHPFKRLIFFLNLFLGCSVIVWIGCLFWVSIDGRQNS